MSTDALNRSYCPITRADYSDYPSNKRTMACTGIRYIITTSGYLPMKVYYGTTFVVLTGTNVKKLSKI